MLTALTTQYSSCHPCIQPSHSLPLNIHFPLTYTSFPSSYQGNEKSSEVLSTLFHLGTKALLQRLPAVFAPACLLQHPAPSPSSSAPSSSHCSSGSVNTSSRCGSSSSSSSSDSGSSPKFSVAQARHLARLPHVQSQQAEGSSPSAPKLAAEEAQLLFCSMTAGEIHNRCLPLCVL